MKQKQQHIQSEVIDRNNYKQEYEKIYASTKRLVIAVIINELEKFPKNLF